MSTTQEMMMSAVAAGGDSTVRPCEHNDWDDVRTRNGYKVLRCRVCQGRWKLPSQGVPRCMAFLHERCSEGAACSLLHVRRKKSNIVERYERFGNSVLEGVAVGIRRKAMKKIASRSADGLPADEADAVSDEMATPLPTTPSVPSQHLYAHCPYSWGDVTPPAFM
eukprot:TRINITY_DN13577_c2_g1_i2.p1 TRINITY_DN13577_c2_g1~~TRINITY_DN13577_c2_g1_i2.p1  ORF type:complete len:165 (+),score=50.29 TRINITY_DN13577_c2_g1_i2:43-537(+)